MNQEQRQQRPRVEWQEDKTFENDFFIVQVSRLPLRVPKFSVSISAKNFDGRPMRFIPVKAEGQGIVRVRPILADLIELIDTAESYLQKQLQLAEDLRIDEMQQREARSMPNGNQPRPGLKELSKRDNVKRQMRDREREKDQS
jgi:mRNA-degrading endonuclease toxin of MazEF toxin-antitoxin module